MAVGAARGDVGRREIALGLALVALAVALYLPTLDHAWLNYDDDIYITGNENLALGLTPSGVGWAFSTFHGANWFPLTSTSRQVMPSCFTSTSVCVRTSKIIHFDHIAMEVQIF